MEEGAYVFITGRRQDKLDEAVQAIGRNVTGVQGDVANMDDLDRLFDTVKREKGHIDIVFASAGLSGSAMLGTITEEQFHAMFALNVRGTLFTVQKALPLFRDGGAIVLNGLIASVKGHAWAYRLQCQQGCGAIICADMAGGVEGPQHPREHSEPRSDCNGDHGRGTGEAKEQFRAMIPRKEFGRPEEIATAVLFLASSNSSFVNDIELYVDGGITQI